MPEAAAVEFVPRPSVGRVFRAERRVRFGEISPGGRSRLDALAGYVQDIAGDDTADAALPDENAWVVRRSVFDVQVPAGFREVLQLETFCSGLGARWAERRVSMRGDRGAHIEAVSLWVRIDAETGRPRALTDRFTDLYGPPAGGRRVSAKLQHDPAVPADATVEPWPLRFSDFDALGHVNNAASWATVEQALARVRDLAPPYLAELEYRDPIERDAEVMMASRFDGELRTWVFDARTGTNYLTGRVSRPVASEP